MMLAPNKPRLIAVPPSTVRHVWPMVHKMIDRAYREIDTDTPVDLFAKLVAERMLLWLVTDDASDLLYAFITELYLRRSGTKVCRLVAGAGERMNEWLFLQQQLEQYAKDEGCSKIVAEGRVGWSRALDGYSVIRHVIEKDL
jgi:hypothetical protein